MLLLDDLFVTPFCFLRWIACQIHTAIENERAAEAKAITTELSELHRRFEAGGLSQEEFASQERRLLDRLDALSADGPGVEVDK